MAEDTCTFPYVSKQDYCPKIATGIKRSWLDLKLEFSRRGEGVPGARYYRTISAQGPLLFAVKPDHTVWYHEEDKWHRCQTATDVKYDKLHSPDLNHEKEKFESTTDDDDELHFGEHDRAKP